MTEYALRWISDTCVIKAFNLSLCSSSKFKYTSFIDLFIIAYKQLLFPQIQRPI